MQGGTAPITLAGAIVLSLAEQMFLYLLQRALWEDAAFGLGGSVSTMDMRSGISCYGRPEQQRINAAFADIGRFYGCATGGHTGLADAKVPSFEAGAQKAAGALWTALACGHASVSAGLLSMDEVCSPVQMILDHDLAESLKALLAEPAVDEETCAFDEIAAVGIGGGYLGTDLTAQRFRQELFRPRTWSGEFLAGWLASGRRTDVDTAREIALDLMRRHPPAPRITEPEEVDLRRVIADAVRHAPFA
jgi:trimethylamine--corrinoid protein Co-methyltransferase